MGTVPVIAGSMGEAAHLEPFERRALIVAARTALDEANLQHVPIVAGTGATSTRETMKLSKEAAEAGVDCVMVIPPGYYAGPLKADREALTRFFVDVAAESSVPV